jgi:beta-glucosidase
MKYFKQALLFFLAMVLLSFSVIAQRRYEKKVQELLQIMTLEEKIGQMCQYVGETSTKNAANENEDEKMQYTLGIGERAELIKQGKIGSFLKVPTYKEANYLQELAAQSRLKIPLLIGTDAIHGHGMDRLPVTIFPTPIGIAASFDPELAEKIARYTAREMRATGNHWTFSPNIEIVRDPRWGRFGETFGEDPLVVSTMGVAMIKGYQGKDMSLPHNVLACAKHFVAGGIAYNGLNGAPADISERTLNEIFFPPFIDAINAGVYSIMPAHNEINGIPCHAHKPYLTDLIRNKWGFHGFFISDWMDIERLQTVHRVAETSKDAAKLAVLAGLDMHMHGPGFLENVKALVKEGLVPMDRINEAVSKILTAKFELGLFENRFIDSAQLSKNILIEEHTQYALEAACKSIVLLKNQDGILPLKKQLRSIFISGPNANNQTLFGDWAVPQPDENVVTVLEGISGEVSGQTEINFVPCPDDVNLISPQIIAEAVKLAKQSDIAILVVGENSMRFSDVRTSGENLDRPTLDFPGKQLALIQAVINTGTPVIIVLVNGAPIASEGVFSGAAGIIEAWEPGMKGGQAIADVIFGNYNPGGKLSVTIPRSVGQIQSFYNYKPSAFHRGRFNDLETTPLYEFGYGLSYTTFEYSNFQLPTEIANKQDVKVTLEVANTGKLLGDEVVLLFLTDKVSSVTTPVKKLVAFKRVTLNPAEKQTVELVIRNTDLSLFDANMQKVVEPGEFEVVVGLSALKKSFFVR